MAYEGKRDPFETEIMKDERHRIIKQNRPLKNISKKELEGLIKL